MKHLFKVQLQNSDMFIEEINIDNSTIDYSIRNKETGELMEPVSRKSKFEIKGENIHFDHRHINVGFVQGIVEIIN